MEPLKIFIGFDNREPIAYEVARDSIIRHASGPVSITPIELSRNMAWGMIDRPLRRNGNQIWDVLSDAPASTEFAASRFLTPLLGQTGPILFIDCDFLALGDVIEILAEFDPARAVQVVKHDQRPSETVKMDNQPQTVYPRKNWSSTILWNADHPANRALTLDKINSLPGRFLHGFCWLEDAEIGTLRPGWNWLVNAEPKPDPLWFAHYTLGGPWFNDWKAAPHDELWLHAKASYETDRRAGEPFRSETAPPR